MKPKMIEFLSVTNADRPWPGLAPYGEEESAFFAGREYEIDALFWAIQMNRLVVLHGQSGIGKTSLLRAGLFPRLRQANFLPIDIRLDYRSDARPLRDQVKFVIAQSIDTELADVAKPGPNQSLWELFHIKNVDFGNGLLTPVLVFDQFEEAFGLGELRRADVNSVLEELVTLAQNSVPPKLAEQLDHNAALAEQFDFDGVPLNMVLAMRSDSLFALNREPMVRCTRTLVNLELRPLTGVQALRVVRQPATELIDEATAEAIVRFVAGASTDVPLEETVVAPPFLSLLCHELNNQRIRHGLAKIGPDLLERAKGEAILKDFYESCFTEVPLPVRSFVEDRLISPAGDRDTVLFDSAHAELLRQGIERPDDFLNLLVNRRLLNAVEAGGVTRIELGDDLLGGVVKRSREMRQSREVAERMRAEQMRSEEERRIAEDGLYAARRQNRRLAVALCLIAVLCALAVCLAVEAMNQRFLADNERRLAVESRSEAEIQRRRAEEAAAAAEAAKNEARKLRAELEDLRASRDR
jgi:hypothetical protein